jgi:hypothetical protein
MDQPGLVSAHAAALLYIIFALATLFDDSVLAYSQQAKEYFLLSRLALRCASPMQDTTLWAIQTLVSNGRISLLELSYQPHSYTKSGS